MGLVMPEQSEWVAKRTADAKSAHPGVTDAAVARIEKMLNGKLQERPLSNAERASLARDLLEEMMPPPPQVEVTV